ncbi:MAG: T9SS type A sorting domain-containing protein [Saprospiraceae bacterium]|nr:T9SS type A sorting domain-containing protein [Saprospiraceae bacterium]
MIKRFYDSLGSLFVLSGLFLCALTTSGQSLISYQEIEELTQNQLTALTSVPALNGVRIFKVDYLTNGTDNLPDTASGLVVLPDDTSVVRILAYQHGTTDGPEDVPSRNNNEALLVKSIAGQGYVVTAADYLGLGDSRGFHPYVHAATEASAGIDLLLAGRDLASQEGFKSMEQIFVTGYSQGGHGAMAMARALQDRETDDLFITAAAPMSGPYSISGIMRDITVQDSIEYFFPAYVAYTLLGYQEIYGNLYDSLQQAFKPQFIGMINDFFQGNIDLSELNDFLIEQLTNDFGVSIPSLLFQEDYLTEILGDTSHPVNVALKDNDNYDWVPQFPLRMYYCTADDQVPFMNSVVAEEFMNSNGADDVMAIDVFPAGDHGDCVIPAVLSMLGFFNGFNVSTSLVERQQFSRLGLFPNPAHAKIQMINIPEDNVDLKVFNQLGILVLNRKAFSARSIDVSELPEGVYQMVLSSQKELWRGSFIIQR